MLQKIRDNTQGLIAKLFVGFIIAVFALFGVDTIVGTFLTSTPALSVNGTDIDQVEIESLTQSKAQEFFTNMGEGADLSGFDERIFRESAMNELIQRELLRQSAEGAGMTMSSASIDRRIAQIPDFQVAGVFNNERATLLLRNLGYTPSSYRAAIARDSLLSQTLAAYTATGFATSSELSRLAALTHQKRTFRYLELGVQTQMEGLAISEEEIETYYQEHQNDFVREEQVRIEYIELSKDALMAEVMVTEEQIRKLYEEEQAAFQAQTERRASHILFEAASEEEFASALEEAETVKARLDAGEDFGALAAESSDDTGSAQNGGDVGYTTGTNFVEEFETALRGLALNEVSAPVRTEFGIHLIKLTGQSDTIIQTYEERRDALERDLRAREADRLFLARSDELDTLAFESLDLEEPASALALERQTSDWFGRSGGVGITALSGVINAAFGPEVLEDGLNSHLISLDASRSVVLRVVDHQPEAVRELAEVMGEIEVLLRLERGRQQARSIGETILSSLQSGDNIDGLLAAQNLNWTQVDAVERSVPTLNPEITEKAFSMSRPAEGATETAGFQLTRGEYVVIQLQSVADGTEADFRENEEQNMRNFLSQQASASDFASFMASLEARADIKGRERLAVVEDAIFE